MSSLNDGVVWKYKEASLFSLGSFCSSCCAKAVETLTKADMSCFLVLETFQNPLY